MQSFEAENPGIDVATTYGSSGNLYSEISHGAPFDIFFSASAAYTGELEALGLVEPGTRSLYASGHIVIWVHDRLGLDPRSLGPELLRRSEVTRVVVANPQHAPYGRAAIEYLRESGLHQAVGHKLVFGENVSQASQIALQSGQVGIIALSLARHPRLSQAGSYFPIPTHQHAAIDQEYVILEGRDRREVREFHAFVQSESGRSILADYGFTLP